MVVAYGLLLPKAILDAPRLGCFNLHGSLLPRWRGAAPIQRAVMAGDAQTGVIVVGIIALMALSLSVLLALRTGRMKRQYRVLSAADGRASFIEVVARKNEEVQGLREDVARLAGALQGTQAELQQAVRHIGVVRYDAFGDMGGRMSFSAAMVDDHGNGFVITTIHARSESRSYIKELRGGMAEVNLSPEETAAVGDAVAGIPDGRIE